MQFLDKKCTTFSNSICKVCKYTCIPFKFLCRLITRFFERPYSFCFIIDFFLLMTPSLLLVVMLAQYSEYISTLSKINVFFYGVLINLILNFISVFYIYEVYGRHKLDEVKQSYTVSSFLKHVIKFLFTESKLGYLGMYYILQILYYFVSLRFLYNNSDLNSDKIEFPVLIVFTKLAMICGLIFTLTHIVIYCTLFMTILCAINNSCLCVVCKKDQALQMSSVSNKKQVEEKGNHKNDVIDKKRNETKFYLIILDCYRFFGLFDYRRHMEIEYEETDNIFDSNDDI